MIFQIIGYICLGAVATILITVIEEDIKYMWQIVILVLFWPLWLFAILCTIKFRK